MRRHLPIALASAAVLACATTGSAAAAPGTKGPRGGDARNLPGFVKKWQGEKQAAADQVARGKKTPDSRGVVELDNGRYVQHALQTTEQMTIALIDFSDLGHNSIPEPDRSKDNSTYWTKDFTPQHYRDMLFSRGGASYGNPSLRDFYQELSSGRFAWDGQVSNWTTVAGSQADYGANSKAGGDGSDNANGPVSRVVKATLDGMAASGDNGGIDIGNVDKTDRYDCDHDGNFNEPDGYIDHFGIVHAGEGEDADGGPDAIWSHRSYANPNDEQGPTGCKMGGYQLGNTGIWVGDYTIEAENGGMGVFAHEFGHDLGLPDYYDTSYGSENSTGFWSLMSSGSWGSYAQDPYIGTSPMHMDAYAKQYLGWLDLKTLDAGDKATFKLGPAEHDTSHDYQAAAINLPAYQRTEKPFPTDGSDQDYVYSGKGDSLDRKAVRTLSGSLSADTPISVRANYDIEEHWDYAYLDAKVGDAWKHVFTSVSTNDSPNNQNFGAGITGTSDGWQTITGTLPAGTTAYRLRYWTDGAAGGEGIAVGDVRFGSTDDTMSDTSAFDLGGWRKVTGGEFTDTFHHWYLAENRAPVLQDRSLCGAYQFTTSTWVEKHCYAKGVVVWYRNEGVRDNNTYYHPGQGEILPVDSHPDRIITPDGKYLWGGRWQAWDAPFSLDQQQITLTQAGVGSKTYTADPVTTFWDSSPTAYYRTNLRFNSVKTAGSGVRLRVLDANADRSQYTVQVDKK
jgi:immune inhibitor A